MELGNPAGENVFVPNKLEFTAGQIYKLRLVNTSPDTHYFTALEFAQKIYTINVLVGDPVVEVKGAIEELELKSGAAATWVFVPIKPGTYALRCPKKGHEAMLGTLVITRA